MILRAGQPVFGYRELWWLTMRRSVTFTEPMQPLRYVVPLLPAAIGSLVWNPLERLAGSGYEFGIHPAWIYLWHPPLMDVLFGALVLAPLVQAKRQRIARIVLLCLSSVIVHTAAVIAVVDSQWLLSPLVEIRFLSAVPVAVVATLVLSGIAGVVARLRISGSFWVGALAAGLVSGFCFLAVLELDTVGGNFVWQAGVHWMIWHSAMNIVLRTARA